MIRTLRIVGFVATVVAAVVILLLPRYVGEFRIGEFTAVAYYFIALLGLNVLTGYSGQISLGHGAFMGIGAYVTAMLSFHYGVDAVWTIPIAGAITGVLGFLFGIPALRLAGVSLALATFAVAVSLPSVAKRFEKQTGGGPGLSLDLYPSRERLYYISWGIAGALFVLTWFLLRGRTGRALRAIRDGEVAAVSSGVYLGWFKTFAFGLSSAYAGIAGALLAIDVAYVNPDTFPVALSILLFASAVVGGLGTLTGVIFGAIVMKYLQLWAQDPPLLDVAFAKQAPAVVYGVLLILFMFVVPGGIAGLFRRIALLGARARA